MCMASWAKQNALASFEKAVLMRPNYAIARFNLAEAIADANPNAPSMNMRRIWRLLRAFPEEADRSALAQSRVKTLKHQ